MKWYIFGVFGYGFTHPFACGKFVITPFYASRAALDSSGYDDDGAFRLTGYGTLESREDLLSDASAKVSQLADVLTFCEQQWVVTSPFVEVPQGQDVAAFALRKRESPIEWQQHRRRLGWTILQQDWLNGTSRAVVVAKLLDQLAASGGEADLFRKSFYRCIEVLKLSRPYIDVEHFLQFSALELLARGHLQSTVRNGGQIIAAFLAKLGFTTSQQDWERWMQYRNALFHKGELEGSFDGTPVSLADVPNLAVLLPDVLLKLIDCQDPAINWNRWADRMPFT